MGPVLWGRLSSQPSGRFGVPTGSLPRLGLVAQWLYSFSFNSSIMWSAKSRI